MILPTPLILATQLALGTVIDDCEEQNASTIAVRRCFNSLLSRTLADSYEPLTNDLSFLSTLTLARGGVIAESGLDTESSTLVDVERLLRLTPPSLDLPPPPSIAWGIQEAEDHSWGHCDVFAEPQIVNIGLVNVDTAALPRAVPVLVFLDAEPDADYGQ